MQFRQGDVLLIEVDGVPFGAVAVPHVVGEPVVLAEGEATGHRHLIADPDVELLRSADALYLRVERDGVALTHEEHDEISLPAGEYSVIRQREYEPATRGGVRRALD